MISMGNSMISGQDFPVKTNRTPHCYRSRNEHMGVSIVVGVPLVIIHFSRISLAKAIQRAGGYPHGYGNPHMVICLKKRSPSIAWDMRNELYRYTYIYIYMYIYIYICIYIYVYIYIYIYMYGHIIIIINIIVITIIVVIVIITIIITG